MSCAGGERPRAKVLFLEPFYGGSHRLFADCVVDFSRHQVDLVTLPASFWKWRMRGGHLSLSERIVKLPENFDCLLVSDMVSLAELKGILPVAAGLPSVVYFHENQLSYPVPKGEAPDVHFGFTNISTALAADRLVFNSRFHLDTFATGVDGLLRVMPDHRPGAMEERLRGKSEVVFPGVDCRELDGIVTEGKEQKAVTILWNHRWEFDKQPELFFSVLEKLAVEGLDFRLHIVGENFQVKPKPFLQARDRLGERIVTFGFIPERSRYLETLRDSDLVVSTAIQEFYGIAVMEAVYCGCRPLLPRRLVYPELYDEEFLYDDEKELERRLREFIAGGLPEDGWHRRLQEHVREKHDVRRSVALLDGVIDSVMSGFIP